MPYEDRFHGALSTLVYLVEIEAMGGWMPTLPGPRNCTQRYKLL